jgi:hypothetical protein
MKLRAYALSPWRVGKQEHGKVLYKEPQKVRRDGFNQIQQRWLFGPPALKIPEVVLQIGLSRKQRKAELAVAKALIALLF